MKVSNLNKWLISGLLAFLLVPLASANTPNHVFQAADDLTANINKIRQQQNITSDARKPGVQIAKTPIHAYTKALEVFEKVNRYKQSKGLATATLPTLPSKKVVPADVLALVKEISVQLTDINRALGINFTGNAKLPVGKTPSDVYENLWQSSYLLDDLVGAISPTFVHRNTLRIEQALIAIANKLGKSSQIAKPEKPQGKKPIDANIQGFKVLYKLVELEKQLDLPPLRVPSFPAGKISPSDVYDTTNNVIAELTRINVKLGLPAVPKASLSTEKITPNEVIFQFKKIQLLLDNLTS